MIFDLKSYLLKMNNNYIKLRYFEIQVLWSTFRVSRVIIGFLLLNKVYKDAIF